ncbi:Y-family DNA polymerase [Flavobacterium sp. SUN046]|uniref:Y-family DNA polymerase n=1 Tax=Flavobacterium sp. SUN046 TaxID=3002440 RepID=UPI002DBFAB64|nr:Y-family DNA polymerase [Flavobacterium sp. SUN046]MEC4048746.1 Y-family DNA polymerase [Flavobacterium sp. SUN046]
MYALIDCNNFYASCERLFKPHLNGQPVVVLSNNDGCVIARSNEAKVLGIPMGAPAFEYKEIFERHNIQVFSSNYELYGDLSNRVMKILSEYSPESEIYSIDECFLRFSGFETYFDYKEMGLDMKTKVFKWVGIPVSVGFAESKALAKIANKIAKKFPNETQGVHIIDTEEKRIKALKWTKIEDVWGIGRQHTKRLKAINVNTAYQFTQLSDEWIRKNLTIQGLRLKKDLEGIASIQMEDVQDKKNIACTRSFEKMHNDMYNLSERVSTFAANLGEKLRKQNSHCNMISVFLMSNHFRQDLQQHRAFINIKTEFPTNSTLELNKLTQMALKSIYKEGVYYKKAGVIVSALTPADNQQLKFFGGESGKHITLMKVIDKTNKKVGGKIKFGQNDLGRKWKMRQEKLSPCYTTRFNDLLTINL